MDGLIGYGNLLGKKTETPALLGRREGEPIYIRFATKGKAMAVVST